MGRVKNMVGSVWKEGGETIAIAVLLPPDSVSSHCIATVTAKPFGKWQHRVMHDCTICDEAMQSSRARAICMCVTKKYNAVKKTQRKHTTNCDIDHHNDNQNWNCNYKN